MGTHTGLLTIDVIQRRLDAFLWPDADDRQRATRERILASATELFVRHGYRKTSMDEVARQAGVAKGTLYLYYRNKAELMFHAVALEECAYLGRLESLRDPTLNAREMLRSLIALGLLVVDDVPLLARLTRGDREIELALKDVDTSVMTEINEWWIEFISKLVREAAGKGLPDSLIAERSQVLIDLLFAVSTSPQLVSQRLPRETHAWTVADIVVDGTLGPCHESGGSDVRRRMMGS